MTREPADELSMREVPEQDALDSLRFEPVAPSRGSALAQGLAALAGLALVSAILAVVLAVVLVAVGAALVVGAFYFVIHSYEAAVSGVH